MSFCFVLFRFILKRNKEPFPCNLVDSLLQGPKAFIFCNGQTSDKPRQALGLGAGRGGVAMGWERSKNIGDSAGHVLRSGSSIPSKEGVFPLMEHTYLIKYSLYDEFIFSVAASPNSTSRSCQDTLLG